MSHHRSEDLAHHSECTLENSVVASKSRFKTFMVGIGIWNVGIGYSGTFNIHQACSDDEHELMGWVDEHLAMCKCVIFSGTRDFDKVVLEGRWRGRRAHSLTSGPWPHIVTHLEYGIDTEESTEWINLSKFKIPVVQLSGYRADDLFWNHSDEILKWSTMNTAEKEAVWYHNYVDVLELGKTLEALR